MTPTTRLEEAGWPRLGHDKPYQLKSIIGAGEHENVKLYHTHSERERGENAKHAQAQAHAYRIHTLDVSWEMVLVVQNFRNHCPKTYPAGLGQIS